MAGVIVGYVVMAALVFGIFTGAYLAMGADRAFTPGTYDVSPMWLALSVVVGLVTAAAGGLVCAVIAKPGSMAPKVLAGLVLVLGLAFMIPVFMDSAPDPGPRTADVSNIEAMTKAKQPKWTAAANPVIGALGVLLGAAMRKGNKAG
jgi:hypothetical protein